MRTVVTVALLGALLGVFTGGVMILLTGAAPTGVVQVGIDLLDEPPEEDGEDDETVIFLVEEGESADSIGQRLEREGFINSALLFRILVSYYGVARNLSAGEYELSRSMSMTEIISILNRGLVRETTITIPEGWRIEQIAERVTSLGMFSEQDLATAIERARTSDAAPAGLPEGASLEGYLLPDTYRVRPSMNASDFVTLLLSSFEEQAGPVVQAAATRHGLTPHEVVTIASIVEREAVVPDERPIIAAVFLNRVKAGMPLQADPTVQFAIAEDPARVAEFGWWKTGLTVDDLRYDSPYNTYVVPGMPPGPICNPGIASIRAVAQSADTDFLYFVAKGDGSGEHLFAVTLEEHNRNVAEAQRE